MGKAPDSAVTSGSWVQPQGRASLTAASRSTPSALRYSPRREGRAAVFQDPSGAGIRSELGGVACQSPRCRTGAGAGSALGTNQEAQSSVLA